MASRHLSRHVVVGCCGWSYFRPREFRSAVRKPYGSVLQAYAQLFSAVEVNSTFYRIPLATTATRWRQEASDVNDSFLFTVKAYHGITHRSRFGRRAVRDVERLLEIAGVLRAPVILFQTPASFSPSTANVKKMQAFFEAMPRGRLLYAWEPRGTWLVQPDAVREVCSTCSLVHCVDPLRHEPVVAAATRVAYFRLHGFGRPSMYRYAFSDPELAEVAARAQSLPRSVKRVYIFFNNVFCYQDALRFLSTVELTGG